jgi:hypothetical protein
MTPLSVSTALPPSRLTRTSAITWERGLEQGNEDPNPPCAIRAVGPLPPPRRQAGGAQAAAFFRLQAPALLQQREQGARCGPRAFVALQGACLGMQAPSCRRTVRLRTRHGA